jgi:hypothetical protein
MYHHSGNFELENKLKNCLKKLETAQRGGTTELF